MKIDKDTADDLVALDILYIDEDDNLIQQQTLVWISAGIELEQDEKIRIYYKN